MKKIKKQLLILISIITGFSCSDKKIEKAKPEPADITGTWKLISGTIINDQDTVVTDYTKNQEMIKIINDTHFAFLRHDLNGGRDSSAVFVSGGGPYTVKNNIYTEFLEYCNHREWENNNFSFEFIIKEDTLTTKGIEKIDEIGVHHMNIEKFVRLKSRDQQ